MKLISTLFVFFFACLIAHAQIFVKHDATGNNDGTSWANAYTDLQSAINVSGPEDQIWLAAGTYTPEGPTPDSSHFLAVKPVFLYGGFSGTETTFSQREWNKNITILSGDINHDDIAGNYQTQRSDNAHHIFILNHLEGQSVLDGITFSGGMTRTDTYAIDNRDTLYNRWRGGALYIKKSGVYIANCTFLDNYGYQGSAIFAGGDTLREKFFTMENVFIHSNSVTTGGAAWISGWLYADLTHCTFTTNASDNFGAGLVAGNMNLFVSECSFNQNTSGQGSGVFLFNNSQSLIRHPRFMFLRCQYTENVAGGTGGAIRLNNFANSFSLDIDSCSFTKNSTNAPFGYGGALLVTDYADTDETEQLTTIKIDHTEFVENSAAYSGGAEFDMYDDSSRIEVTNSRFYKNVSPQNGGGSGLYFYVINYAVVDAQVLNTTFEENKAALSGGGIVFDFNSNIQKSAFNIEDCHFIKNHADGFGGAIATTASDLTVGPIGTIRNSTFTNNDASGMAGAIFALAGKIKIDGSKFSGNSSEGLNAYYPGSGATYFGSPSNIEVLNTIYEDNISDDESGTVFIDSGAVVKLENVLLTGNLGHSVVMNRGSLKMINNSVLNNIAGLHLASSSVTEIQNSIFDNSGVNLLLEDSTSVITKGGNLSSDGTMSTILTGFGSYNDLHSTDPLLGPDFVPLAGSPAIDAGNLLGIKYPFDLAGNPRVQGNGIDAGAYETFLVATHDAVWNSPTLTVFPNPVKDVLNFNLETDWIGDIRLSLYNTQGQQVWYQVMKKSNTTQNFNSNIGFLSAGEYVLLAKTGDANYACHIIVQR